MSRETAADRGESDRRERASLRARWAIARRQLRSLRSEKTILLALAIQLFIAGFSSFLVVGLVSLYDPEGVDGYRGDVAIAGDDPEKLLAVTDEQSGLEPTYYRAPESAYADFERGAVDAVLDANRNGDGVLVVRVLAPDEGLHTTLLVVQLQEALETVERIERVENADRLENPPLSVPQNAPASPYFGFTYTVLLPLLLFLPVFISGSIAVDSLIEERQRGTLELLQVAPLSFADVIDAKLATTAALAPVQAVLWLLLLSANGTSIVHPAALVVFVAVLALSVVAVGIGVALSAPDRRQAQLLYSTGILAVLLLAARLPEHPANTIAKLAVGSATRTTWLLLAAYAVVGILAFVAVRIGVARIDPERL